MIKHYYNYLWKNGTPYGIRAVEEKAIAEETSYKIVTDPYNKHISIEKYVKGKFTQVVYDSQFLNFKKLKPEFQTVWQKTIIKESAQETCCLIRDQDDRIILIETYFFEEKFCRECEIRSAHNVLIGYQKTNYTQLGDPFNGVLLLDAELVPVMFKEYELDEEMSEFTTIKNENWTIEPKEYEWLKSTLNIPV